MDTTIKIITIVAITWLFTEVIKIVLEAKEHGKIQWRTLFKYGGMPSAHSCFVTSLAVTIFLAEGLTTNLIIAAAIWILVIRDLLVIRTSIDRNANNLEKTTSKIKNIPTIKAHTIMHTKIEMLVGSLIGLIGSYLLWLII